MPDLEHSARYYRDMLGFNVKEIRDLGWRLFVREQCLIMAGEGHDALPPQELCRLTNGEYSMTLSRMDCFEKHSPRSLVGSHGATTHKKIHDRTKSDSFPASELQQSGSIAVQDRKA